MCIYGKGKAVNVYKLDIVKGTYNPESVRSVSGDDMVDIEQVGERESECVIVVLRTHVQVVMFLFLTKCNHQAAT